jgi:hypothetical protein
MSRLDQLAVVSFRCLESSRFSSLLATVRHRFGRCERGVRHAPAMTKPFV